MLTNGKATVKGILEHAGDLDSWVIEIPDAKWRVSVEPNPCGPNIDLKMAVRVGLNGPPKSYNNETSAKYIYSCGSR